MFANRPWRRSWETWKATPAVRPCGRRVGARNFFELAVAAAVSLFGLHSGAALATVAGVLIEVPVMLSAVKIVNASKDWYEKSPAVIRNG